jgi:hypothetical protein
LNTSWLPYLRHQRTLKSCRLEAERRRGAAKRINDENTLGLRRRRSAHEEQPDCRSDRDDQKKLRAK